MFSRHNSLLWFLRARYKLDTSEDSLSLKNSLILSSFYSASYIFASLFSSDFERFTSHGILYYFSDEGSWLELVIGSTSPYYFLLFL